MTFKKFSYSNKSIDKDKIVSVKISYITLYNRIPHISTTLLSSIRKKSVPLTLVQL